jgi:alginate O-acetyltransferase complex protein AlgI
VLIADQLGAVASHVFDNPTAELPLGFAWIGVLSYSLQIYYDFSGYSDMALGLARMFGFKIIENFDQPYLSRNFNEFWRRWHISLTAFMREYLYVAIGGNRYGRLRTYLNLWIVFLLSGFWHGASWNFLIWGAFHGFFLSLNKLATEQGWPRPPRVVGVATTFLLVSLGWVVFRSETLADAAAILSALFDFSAGAYAMAPAELISNRGAATLVFASVATFISWERFAVFTRQASSDPLVVALRGLLAVLFFCFSLTALAASGFSPFLYFKF